MGGPDERAYDERLRVPLRWWVQTTMLLASLWLALVVALPPMIAGAIAAALGVLAALLLLDFGRARILVTEGMLHAGRARIETRFLGAAESLDAGGTRAAAGVEADARAFLLLRPYLKRAVRVRVEDPRDPTPYWLLSTRHPERLAAALSEVARTPHPTTLDPSNPQED